MARRSPTFGSALRDVRTALGLSQDPFGERLGVSRRTLTRWEIHDELPPVGQRKHIATSFPDAPAELVAALVRALELPDGFVASAAPARPAPAPAPAPVASPPPDAAALDSAFLELCERVEIAPGPMRAGLVDFLRRAEASGFSLPAARAQLEPRAKTKAKPG